MKNCKIQGSGRVTEGEYDIITIEGAGKLVDDVTVNTVNVSGVMIAKGKLRAKEIKSIGMIKLFKEADIDSIQIDKGVLISKSDILLLDLDLGSLDSPKIPLRSCDEFRLESNLKYCSN